MVSPELSRKLAKLFPMLMALGMTVSERFELAGLLENVSGLTELDKHWLDKIEVAKKLKNSGTSEMDVIKNPEKYKNFF